MVASEAGTPEPDTEAAAWVRRQMRQAAAYDHIGDRYEEAFPHKDGQLNCGDWLMSRIKPHARVLDIGCGTGMPTARQFAAAGFKVTGIDISSTMCGLARRNVPQARFLQADLLNLDAVNGLYEAVVAFFSLLNLPRAKMPDALRVIRQVLVPGGWFSLAMVEADVDDIPISFLGQEVRVTGYFRDELTVILEAAGFTVEQEKVMSYAPATTQAQPEVQLFLNCRRVD